MTPFVQDSDFTLYVGDVRDCLRELPDESVHTVVTSPPYWGLRDYGADGQIGLEESPEAFVAAMVDVFREVRRVLRSDGTCWVNLGDSYAAGQSSWAKWDRPKQQTVTESFRLTHPTKPKDLCGIPWRVAFALQQPYERRVIHDVADRAWLAGLIDGEGCFSCQAIPAKSENGNESHSMRLQVRMADVEAVERIVAITGMNSVTYDQLPPSYIEAGQRAAQQWKISGDNMADITADIYPFLTVKRRQAIVAWNLQRLRDGIVTKRGQPVPLENMEKRRLLYDVIRKLNQREPVDIPSWCREPEVYTEPGWYLRSDCIWAKPNPMPESVTDRPTKAHEYVFLLTKSPRYFFDQEAVREPADRAGETIKGDRAPGGLVNGGWLKGGVVAAGRNVRSVWEIATQPYPEAHFATFPEALPERCIKAGTSERGCCPDCGSPWARLVERTRITRAQLPPDHPEHRPGLYEGKYASIYRENAGQAFSEAESVGWQPSCECSPTGAGAWPPVPCTVLDPFMGSGTTALVARRLGRRSVGVELNPEYAALCARRLQQLSLLAEV